MDFKSGLFRLRQINPVLSEFRWSLGEVAPGVGRVHPQAQSEGLVGL